MLNVVEDQSRIIWIYLLQSKDQVPEVLSSYIKMVEYKFGIHIKAFRTDNGT